LPIPFVSNSGIQYERWFCRSFSLYGAAGVAHGPLFRTSVSSPDAATTCELDVLLQEALESVRFRRRDLFDGDGVENISFYRSMRSGAHSQARNRKTPEDYRNLIARWRTEDRAGQKDPSLAMPEHYTDVAAAVEAMIFYPQNM
jgi:hypothetical protein